MFKGAFQVSMFLSHLLLRLLNNLITHETESYQGGSSKLRMFLASDTFRNKSTNVFSKASLFLFCFAFNPTEFETAMCLKYNWILARNSWSTDPDGRFALCCLVEIDPRGQKL